MRLKQGIKGGPSDHALPTRDGSWRTVRKPAHPGHVRCPECGKHHVRRVWNTEERNGSKYAVQSRSLFCSDTCEDVWNVRKGLS